jgi:hypothetical protein
MNETTNMIANAISTPVTICDSPLGCFGIAPLGIGGGLVISDILQQSDGAGCMIVAAYVQRTARLGLST